MSLQELPGSTIHLKLSIIEGHGFGFLKSPIVIVAGTNGILLETDVVPPSPDPIFNIVLVWETDKKNLRRFRASNTPIKLECFTVGQENKRECIGSILLNIKSAQVILDDSSKNVNEKWHRLIGVPSEAKALQPELLLSLTIQSPSSLSQPISGIKWEEKAITPDDSKKKVPQAPQEPPVAPSTVPVPEYKQGYIQLGPENTSIDTFLLHICVKQVLELELLLRHHQDLTNFDNSSKPFQVSFIIMGQSMSTNFFGFINWDKDNLLNEEVIFPLRASLTILHNYLQDNPCATVCFLCHGQEIAATELHIRSLVPTNNIQSFSREFCGESTLTQNCILVSSSSGTIPLEGDLQPSIEVITKLRLVSSLMAPPMTRPAFNKPKAVSDSIPHQIVVTGQLFEDLSSRSESRQSQDTFIVTTQSGPVWIPVAHSSIQSYSAITKDERKLISKEHPDNTIRVVPNQQENLTRPVTDAYKATSKVSQSLQRSTDSYFKPVAPMTSLTAEKERGPNMESELHMTKFTGPELACEDEKQHSSNMSPAPLKSQGPQKTFQSLSSTAGEVTVPLDSGTVYKIVEELEDWKEKQEEIFLAELKKREREHIATLTDEWTAQTKVQAIEIENKMAECKTLAESLSSTKQDLRDRLKICAVREQELRKAKEDLDLQYNVKFQELALAAKRLDEGVKLKVALLDSKCSKLEERVRELESENETLHQQLHQKSSVSSSNGQMCGLSHNQVSQLLAEVDQLEGKLHESLQSKAYFKEQWCRAVREMNQAKLQFAQTSDSNKCLEKLLGKEEKELENDQKTLERLRQEIAHLNPNS